MSAVERSGGTMTNAKELNERWIRAFNERDWETERAVRTDDYLAHMSGAPGQLDSEGWAGFMAMFTSAFTDASISIDGAVEEGDLVASRWTITGTHDGPFQGVPATGRSVTIPGIDMSRVVDGKVAEHWAQFDLVGVMQQIGAMPPPA
jgi:steroid delta-isomerase-like uncharacterized protein